MHFEVVMGDSPGAKQMEVVLPKLLAKMYCPASENCAKPCQLAAREI